MTKIPDRMQLLRDVGKEYDYWCEAYSKELLAIGNSVPVGGSHMDAFFKSEGLRGVTTALRQGKTLEYSIKFGEDVMEIAVKLWNQKREYQVHYWEKHGQDWLANKVRSLLLWGYRDQ